MPRGPLFALFAGLALFLVLANYGAARRDRPYYDVVAYLDLSADLAEGGGAAGLLEGCLKGTYTEANRHPLYPLLLAPLAGRSGGFFVRAKLLDILLGAFLVFSLWLIAYRMAGGAAAALCAILAATNATYIIYASTVAADLLFTILVLWSWRATSVWLTQGEGEGAGTERAGPSLAWAVLAGLLAGLAYLAKASGLLLAPAFVLAVLFLALRSGGGAYLKRRAPGLAFYLVLLLAVAAPLIVRNLVVYGSPFYNINQHVMWLDRWPDFFDYRREGRLGELGLGWYLAQHPWWDPLLRMATGARDIFLGLSKTLLGFRPSGWSLLAYVPLAAGLLAVAGHGLRRDPVRPRRVYTIFLLVAFLLPLQWYCRVTCAERFFLPVVAVLHPYLAWGAVRFLGRLYERKGRDPADLEKKVPAAAGALALTGALAAILVVGLPNPLTAFRVPPKEQALERWMKEHVRPDEFWLQDNRSRFQPSWRLGLPGRFDYVPWETPPEEVRRIVGVTGAAWLLIDCAVRPAPFLAELVAGGCNGTAPIPSELFGWTLAYPGPEGPARFIVYRTKPQEEKSD